MAIGQRRVLDPTTEDRRGIPPARVGVLQRAPVSLVIIVASVAATLMNYATHDQFNQYAALVPAWAAQGQWYRVLSCIPAHGGAIHVLFNMSVVWTLGVSLERAVGSWRFAVISLVTALGSSTLVMLLAPNVATVGASGMILGYAGAMLPIATSEGRRSLMTWLVQIAIISLLPMVSWQGHLGGFLFGLPCGVLLRNNARDFGIGTPFLVGGAVLLCAGSIYLRAMALGGMAP